jgi:hypothetical protein
MSMRAPNHYRYEFVRVGDDWKIADIASLGTGRWRLSQTRCGRAGRPAAAEAPPTARAAAVAVGASCYRNRHSTLRFDIGANGSARFRLEALGGNGHSCFVEQVATPTPQGWRYEESGAEGRCQLDLVRTASGAIAISDRDWICRRYVCGARASLVTSELRRSRDLSRCNS